MRAFAPNDGMNGLQQDDDIEKQAIDIVQIVLQFFACVFFGGTVGKADLRPAGNAWFDHVPHCIERDLFGQFRHELRAPPRTAGALDGDRRSSFHRAIHCTTAVTRQCGYRG